MTDSLQVDVLVGKRWEPDMSAKLMAVHKEIRQCTKCRAIIDEGWNVPRSGFPPNRSYATMMIGAEPGRRVPDRPTPEQYRQRFIPRDRYTSEPEQAKRNTIRLAGRRNARARMAGRRPGGRVIRLRIELSKNKTGRVLPLSGELLAVIERAADRRRLDCPRVFHRNGKFIGDFRDSWRRACVSTGLGALAPTGYPTPNGKPELRYEGLTPHDLRRSAVRNMVRAGIPERVCMALSGHKTRAIFDRYNIVSESDLTAAADRLHEHLREQPKAGRLVPLKAPRRAC